MKTLIRRIKSSRGESLIETMAAMLIFTFASILFLSLTSAAANINLSVKEADDSFQAQQAAVETKSGTKATALANLYIWTDDDNNGLANDNEYDSLGSIIVSRIESDSGDDHLYAYEVENTP